MMVVSGPSVHFANTTDAVRRPSGPDPPRNWTARGLSLSPRFNPSSPSSSMYYAKAALRSKFRFIPPSCQHTSGFLLLLLRLSIVSYVYSTVYKEEAFAFSGSSSHHQKVRRAAPTLHRMRENEIQPLSARVLTTTTSSLKSGIKWVFFGLVEAFSTSTFHSPPFQNFIPGLSGWREADYG